jgi:hypothetical protein
MTIARFALMPDISSLRDAMDRLGPLAVAVDREHEVVPIRSVTGRPGEMVSPAAPFR